MEDKKIPALFKEKPQKESYTPVNTGADVAAKNKETATKIVESPLTEQISSFISIIPKLEESVLDLDEKVTSNKKELATKIELVDVNRKIDREENIQKIIEVQTRVETIEKIVESGPATESIDKKVLDPLITQPNQTDNNISKLPKLENEKPVGKNKENQKIIEGLNKILFFLKKNRDEDKLEREKQKNFEAEQKEEKERAEKGLVGRVVPKKPTKVKQKEPEKQDEVGGIFGFLKNLLTGITELFSSLKGIMSIFGKIGSFIGKIGPLVMRVISFFAGPVGIALLGALSLGALLKMMWDDKDPTATTKAITAAGAPDAAAASEIAKVSEVTEENAIERKKQNLLANRPKEEKSWWNPIKDSELQKNYLKKIGWDPKTGTTESERNSGIEKIDVDGNPVYKKNDKGATAVPAPATTTPTPSTAGSPGATASTGAMGAAGSAGATGAAGSPGATGESASMAVPATPSAEQTSTPTGAPVPAAAAEAPEGNLGTKMASISKENAEMKLFDSIGETLAAGLTNITSMSTIKEENTIKKIPAVRNQEDTFQRMIYNNTRLV